MQVRTPAGQFASRIGNDVQNDGARAFVVHVPGRIAGLGRDPGHSDNPQQFGGWRPAPATHTSAHRIRATCHPN
jgi:hypothetical protein